MKNGLSCCPPGKRHERNADDGCCCCRCGAAAWTCSPHAADLAAKQQGRFGPQHGVCLAAGGQHLAPAYPSQVALSNDEVSAHMMAASDHTWGWHDAADKAIW